jgi:hypothetical protein
MPVAASQHHSIQRDADIVCVDINKGSLPAGRIGIIVMKSPAVRQVFTSFPACCFLYILTAVPHKIEG